MTQTTPTTTAQATVKVNKPYYKNPILDERTLATLEYLLTEGPGKDHPHDMWNKSFARDLIRSHRALTEQVRVLREALEFYADDDTYGEDMNGYGTPIPDSVVVLNDNGETARRTLDALEGEQP